MTCDRRLWLALPLALALAACADDLVSPSRAPVPDDPLLQERPQRGTGLALENVVGGLPIVGDIQISQVVITEFSTFLGGLQASGTITGASVTVPGLTVTDDFTTDVLVSSSSSGRCDLVTIDVAPLDADLLGLVASTSQQPTCQVKARARSDRCSAISGASSTRLAGV